MNFKEAVDREFIGEDNDLERRKRIWGEISNSYIQGGEDEIKSILSKCSDNIIKEFDELISRLRAML